MFRYRDSGNAVRQILDMINGQCMCTMFVVSSQSLRLGVDFRLVYIES